MNSTSPSVRVEVYVQSLTPSKHHQIGPLLEQIEETELITTSKSYVVGREICPETALKTDVGQHLCGRFLQFRDWARRTGRRLDSFFQPRTVRSAITAEEYETISVPTFTLAEFTNDTLQFVTPCTDGDTHYTPHDRLTELSAVDPYTETDQQPSRV